MIGLLVGALVLLLLLYIAKLVVNALELPANIKIIVMLIISLIVLVALLRHFGIVVPGL